MHADRCRSPDAVSAEKSRLPPSVGCFSMSRCAHTSSSRNGKATAPPIGCQLLPCRALRCKTARECPPTHIGGCGFCTGKDLSGYRVSVETTIEADGRLGPHECRVWSHLERPCGSEESTEPKRGSLC